MHEGAASTTRSHYVDNLKSYFTALVIYHHTAISYGGEGNTPYRSSLHPRGTSTALVGFNALNQTFFMGSFFYLSGYFSRKALERKGPRKFVSDRLYRLGLPTGAYTLLGPPVCDMISHCASGRAPQLSLFVNHWKTIQGVRGPVWFTATLLLLDLLYASVPSRMGLRYPPTGRTRSAEQTRNVSQDTFKAIAIASSAAAAFLIRLYYPLGVALPPLGLQVGYLPQYILAYVYGTSVSAITDMLPSWTLSALLVPCHLFLGRYLVMQHHASPQALQELSGGWSRVAFAYALWNETTGYLLASASIALFRRYVTSQWNYVCRDAFAAFLVHIPVSVLVGVSLDTWSAGGEVKAAVAGTINVIVSWLVGSCLSEVWTITMSRLEKLVRPH